MSSKNSYAWGLFLAMLGFIGVATTTAPVLSLLLVMLGLALMLIGPSQAKKHGPERPQKTPPAK